MTSGTTDAWGTQRAFRLTNGSAGSLRLQQTLETPASYCYTLSLYARANQPGRIRLLRGTDALDCAVTPTWRRLFFTGDEQSTDESITFGVELDAGAAVEVCGLQVEAQPGASTYKKSDGKGGVYTEARLATDSLNITTHGPNRHACVLQVRHAEHI